MRVSLGWSNATAAGMAVCGYGDMGWLGGFIGEFMWCFIILFICYGIAFDPKQGELFGPKLVPAILSLVM